MPKSFSIKIFLPDGAPDGLRIVERTNWTGIALCFPRTKFPSVRSRLELNRPGVYVLVGQPESSEFRQRVYIGEAEKLRTRLTQHAKKEFWTQCVAFTTKDEEFNKAHARYLEARLLELALAARRAEMENGMSPVTPHLSEADTADMESFLSDMLIIYPLLGVEAFEPLDVGSSPATSNLFLKSDCTEAEGRETADGFLVLEGSVGRRKTSPSFRPGFQRMREDLTEKGVLEVEGERLRLMRDHLFGSASTAASVFVGRSANGRKGWKDADGRTLAEIQNAALVSRGGES